VTTKSKRKATNTVQFLDLGLRFSLAIVICVGAGYWLDTKLHTVPLFLIAGLLLGATTGFMTIYRTVYPANAAKKNNGE
jgi:F0F1-type ATP synthase assembly protein I